MALVITGTVIIAGCFLVMGINAAVGSRRLTVERFVAAEHDTGDAWQILRLIDKPRKTQNGLQFKWTDCGSPSSLLHVSSASLSPDPVDLPGNVTFGFSASVSSDLPSTLLMDLTVKKKIAFIWVEVPCLGNIGSCSNIDVCSVMSMCPPAFKQHGIPCECPIKKGSYTLPPSSILVDIDKVPSGDYEVWAKIHSQNDGDIGCVNVAASVQ